MNCWITIGNPRRRQSFRAREESVWRDGRLLITYEKALLAEVLEEKRKQNVLKHTNISWRVGWTVFSWFRCPIPDLHLKVYAFARDCISFSGFNRRMPEQARAWRWLYFYKSCKVPESRGLQRRDRKKSLLSWWWLLPNETRKLLLTHNFYRMQGFEQHWSKIAGALDGGEGQGLHVWSKKEKRKYFRPVICTPGQEKGRAKSRLSLNIFRKCLVDILFRPDRG